ncbi:MAG: EamA family transporter [Chelatococcus sp.]|nr:MAG: EamA family transporter [Chelatococcus sp.]
MLLAMSFFVSNDVLMKLAREAYPPGQAIALRTIFAVMTGIVIVMAMRHGRSLRLAFRPILLVRGALDAATGITYVWALGMIPIANATALALTTPLMIVVIAVALRIEPVGWRRTLALLVGFAGVLVVLRPSAAGFDTPALMVLLSAFLVSCRDVLTRSIRAEIPAPVVALSTTIISGAIATVYGGLREEWVPMLQPQAILLVIAALLISIGSIFIIGAYRNTDVGVVSGYRYAVIVYALIAGFLIWGDVPDAISFVGMALIVASGLYTIHRQRVRADSNLKQPLEPTR